MIHPAQSGQRLSCQDSVVGMSAEPSTDFTTPRISPGSPSMRSVLAPTRNVKGFPTPALSAGDDGAIRICMEVMRDRDRELRAHGLPYAPDDLGVAARKTVHHHRAVQNEEYAVKGGRGLQSLDDAVHHRY